jgi:DNA-directed RNA polymerase specialized sigma24 family protein
MSSDRILQEPIFATTHWSVVLHAGRPSSPEAARALDELCRIYWYPLYAYVRRQGFDVPTAQDLTQDFFAKLLEKNYVGVADRKRGKFRWFLLTAFKCFLANEWDRARAQKRGGGAKPLSLDGMTAEERYRHEPADALTADQLYDRRWALDLIERARGRLRDEYLAAGKAGRLAHLEPFLAGGQPAPDYVQAALQLGLSEAAVRQEAHRFKRHFGELLREEVARTVAQPDEVAEELRYLIDVVCRWGGVE